MLTIKVRDANLVPVGLVDDYVELRMSERWLGVGAWSLVLPTDSPSVAALLAPGAGIVVSDGETVLFSGPVELGGGGLPVAVREQADNAGLLDDRVTVYGTDDMVWLADRVAHPSPSTGVTTAQAYDVRSGIATSVIRQYVDANCGPGALTARRVAGLVLAADPVAGAHVSGAGRWQNLLDLVGELARQGGVTVTALQSARQVVVTVAATADRSAGVRFGVELGNVRRSQLESNRSDGTAMYVAGQGVGAARSIATAVVPGRRVERFIDRRDVADAAELAVIAAAELAERVGTSSLSVEPVDTDHLRYGVDYRLGDLVGVLQDGSTVVERVVAVETQVTVEGVVRSLAIGQTGDAGAVGIWRNVARLAGRLNQLERV